MDEIKRELTCQIERCRYPGRTKSKLDTEVLSYLCITDVLQMQADRGPPVIPVFVHDY